MNHIVKRLRLFLADTRGVVSVEAVILFPMVTWAFVAMFVFFDAFRAQNTNLKAAYTISDMLSRKVPSVDQAYLDGLNTVFDYLTYKTTDTWIRVTLVRFDSINDEHNIDWSHATKSVEPLTTANFASTATHVPIMSHGDRVIIVETDMEYEPAFNVGLNTMNFNNLVVTRPRFAGQLCWEEECVGENDNEDDPEDQGGGADP